MLENLYEALSHLSGEENELNAGPVATPQIISHSLKLIFGEKIHFLDSLELQGDSDDIDIKENYVYVYISKIREVIRKDNRELKIPIVAIWSISLDMSSTDSVHWQTLVILPKHYRSHTGRYLGNESEIVFFKDSQASAALPLVFKRWLKEVSSHSLQPKDSHSTIHKQKKYLQI